MRRLRDKAVAAAAGPILAGAVAGVIVACGSPPAPPSAPPAVKPSTNAARTPKSVPYDLYTHCGIYYTRVGTRYYVATHPLTDGSDNPPPGWGNPYQPGTMTLVSPDEAVFTDKAGHRVVFMLAAPVPAKTSARVCA